MDGARLLNIPPLHGRHVEQFQIYLDELKRWNRRINLTSLKTDGAIIERHFLDSLMGVKAFDFHKGLRLIDIGTGAGFPGIPIKLYYPDIALSLVEPAHKKAAFLHHLCGTLNLTGVSIIAERVDIISRIKEPQRGYEVTVARAFARPQKAFEAMMPLLAPNGRMLLYVSSARGLGIVSSDRWQTAVMDYKLPFSGLRRAILVITPQCES